MGWITRNISGFITDIIGSILDYFGDLISNIFVQIVQWNCDNVYVQGASLFLEAFALAMVAVIVGKQVFDGYVAETDYDSEADPFNLIVRMSETVAIITCSGWIFDYMFELSKKFANDMIGAAAATGANGEMRRLLAASDLNQASNAVNAFNFVLFIIMIALIIFTIVACLRGCELIAMKMFMPIMALDLLTTSRERWNNYFMGFILAFSTYGIQILFYQIALKSLVTANYSSPIYLIGGITWLVLAIKGPKFLEKYLYKSGVTSAASSGLRMVAMTTVMKAA